MNYFLIVISSSGTILVIGLMAFLWEPAGPIPIIYFVSLIGLHIYFSIKVIKAYQGVAKEKKSTQTGFYAKAQKILFRAKFYFITLWGFIILSIIYFYIWILPQSFPPPELVGQAVGQFLDKFFGVLPSQK